MDKRSGTGADGYNLLRHLALIRHALYGIDYYGTSLPLSSLGTPLIEHGIQLTGTLIEHSVDGLSQRLRSTRAFRMRRARVI